MTDRDREREIRRLMKATGVTRRMAETKVLGRVLSDQASRLLAAGRNTAPLLKRGSK